MDLSIVIPCFNDAETIEAQLKAILNQDTHYSWEVIIVDNRSTDNSAEIAQKYCDQNPNFRLVKAWEKKGAAYTRNAGVTYATGDFIAFCDADDVIASGWINVIVEALSKYDLVASCHEYRVLNPPQLYQKWRIFQEDKLQTMPYSTLPFSGTSGLAVKHAVHIALNGFDEAMICCEDIDYCWRAQLLGKQLHLSLDAVVHYRLRHSITARYRQTAAWTKYNVLLYKKHQSSEFVKPLPQAFKGWKGWLQLLRDWVRLIMNTPQQFEDEESRDRHFHNIVCSTVRLLVGLRYQTLYPY